MTSIRVQAYAPQTETSLRAEPTGDADFGAALQSAVKAVDQLQLSADAQAQSLTLGHGNLHETALALEKADVAMRVAVKARNRLVDAYQEVMRMTV